jgi:hypothetical protein
MRRAAAFGSCLALLLAAGSAVACPWDEQTAQSEAPPVVAQSTPADTPMVLPSDKDTEQKPQG